MPGIILHVGWIIIYWKSTDTGIYNLSRTEKPHAHTLAKSLGCFKAVNWKRSPYTMTTSVANIYFFHTWRCSCNTSMWYTYAHTLTYARITPLFNRIVCSVCQRPLDQLVGWRVSLTWTPSYRQLVWGNQPARPTLRKVFAGKWQLHS